MRTFENFWKKSFGFGKKKFGSDTETWFWSHTTWACLLCSVERWPEATAWISSANMYPLLKIELLCALKMLFIIGDAMQYCLGVVHHLIFMHFGAHNSTFLRKCTKLFCIFCTYIAIGEPIKIENVYLVFSVKWGGVSPTSALCRNRFEQVHTVILPDWTLKE